jgi:hypothetical protein
MKYERAKELNGKEFRRLTGVKPATFEKMVEIVKAAQAKKKVRGGRPNKLTVEDMVLMTLEYLREYRTYFHIGNSYGISESNAWQTGRWVENVLIQSGIFRLEGKRALYQGDRGYKVILIDATESPIERPQKNKNGIIRGKRSGTA